MKEVVCMAVTKDAISQPSIAINNTYLPIIKEEIKNKLKSSKL